MNSSTIQIRLKAERETLINNFVAKLNDPITGKQRPNIMHLDYPDGGRYIGEVLNDSLARHGVGIFWYPKDDVYMGEW
jgi:hypothetical protein